MNNKEESRLFEIHNIINELKDYWTARPYLRLGQIVSNAWQVHPSYRANPEPEISDIFYLNDARFVEGLNILAAPNTNESEGSRPT